MLVSAGCSTRFPQVAKTTTATEQAAAQAIFERCLAAHGGDIRTLADDLNLSIDGTWSTLIQRIQPLVTDSAYRITAQERFRPSDQLYAVWWQGPAGTKKVLRTPTTVEVTYNGIRELDEKKLQAAAMTADAFQLFHLGPSFLQMRDAAFVRLDDAHEAGVTYQRLLTTLRPGFGFSPADDVVIWIDPRTNRLFRVHLTLNGFETTQGAHVDTTFLEYRQVGRLLLPTQFRERVRGPIRIHAHDWWMTGADLARGWDVAAVSGPDPAGGAAAPAYPIDSLPAAR
jgi:hypothetical protein